MFTVAGTLCYYALYIATSLFVLGGLDVAAEARLVWELLQRPLTLLGLALAASLLFFAGPRLAPSSASVLRWSAMMTSAVLLVTGPQWLHGPAGWQFGALLLGALVTLDVAWWIVARRVRAPPARLSLLMHLTVMLGLALALGGIPVEENDEHGKAHVNRLGLVAGRPDHVMVVEALANLTKDHYPRCTYATNSLGFRDVEPDASPPDRPRVLLVGDSFVYGDGIPTNEQTLGAYLRPALAVGAVPPLEVVSAAFPGLGLYGYSRYIATLEPVIGPAVVVMGFLGSSEFDPVDAQFLADAIPKSAFLRGIVLHLRVLQSLHRASASEISGPWRKRLYMDQARHMIQVIADSAGADRCCVIVLNYLADPGNDEFALFGDGLRIFTPPPELAYPGAANRYWYGKDKHPKPDYNRALAPLLAAEVRRCLADCRR